jgi:hypothetical protein
MVWDSIRMALEMIMKNIERLPENDQIRTKPSVATNAANAASCDGWCDAGAQLTWIAADVDVEKSEVDDNDDDAGAGTSNAASFA